MHKLYRTIRNDWQCGRMFSVRVFFRDIRREWNYGSPSKFNSRVWIRIWQQWNVNLTRRPYMRRYMMVVLAVPDFFDRLYRAFR